MLSLRAPILSLYSRLSDKACQAHLAPLALSWGGISGDGSKEAMGRFYI